MIILILTDSQMYWQTELNLPQDVILIENAWPEGELDLSNHHLVSMPNSSAQVYCKVQIVVEQVVIS